MGLTQELSDKVNRIKSDVMRRFKYQRFTELNEELKKLNKKDKKTLRLLDGEIKALKYDPNSDGENIVSLEEIEPRVKSLIEEIQEREHSLINEDGEVSMLCELNVRNLINFLKHFKVEINFDEFDDEGEGDNCDDEKNGGMKEEHGKNKEIIRNLTEKCYLLENTLKLKVLFLFL